MQVTACDSGSTNLELHLDYKEIKIFYFVSVLPFDVCYQCITKDIVHYRTITVTLWNKFCTHVLLCTSDYLRIDVMFIVKLNYLLMLTCTK